MGGFDTLGVVLGEGRGEALQTFYKSGDEIAKALEAETGYPFEVRTNGTLMKFVVKSPKLSAYGKKPVANVVFEMSTAFMPKVELVPGLEGEYWKPIPLKHSHGDGIYVPETFAKVVAATVKEVMDVAKAGKFMDHVEPYDMSRRQPYMD